MSSEWDSRRKSSGLLTESMSMAAMTVARPIPFARGARSQVRAEPVEGAGPCILGRIGVVGRPYNAVETVLGVLVPHDVVVDGDALVERGAQPFDVGNRDP